MTEQDPNPPTGDPESYSTPDPDLDQSDPAEDPKNDDVGEDDAD